MSLALQEADCGDVELNSTGVFVAVPFCSGA